MEVAGEIIAKGHEESLVIDREDLFLDSGGNFMGLCICQNSSNYILQIGTVH